MSRAYRISVSDSRREHVVVDDCVTTGLELLAILPQRRMGELLAHELEARGFERDEKDPTSMTREDGEISIRVDLEKGTIGVRIRSEKDVEAQAALSRASATQDNQELKTELEGRVQKRLEAAIAAEKKKLTDEAATVLDKKLRDLRAELDGATTAVTRKALQEKAAQLGEIEEITEDESGSITIKVRV